MHKLSIPRLARLFLLPLALGLSACATLPNHDPPMVSVAGVEPLEGQGMELRFAIKLRVQNPNGTELSFRGAALKLDVNGQRLASGVSDQAGTVPAYGETLFTVPVTVPMLAAARQIIGMMDNKPRDGLPYVVSGKLDSGMFGTVRFSDQGRLGKTKSTEQ